MTIYIEPSQDLTSAMRYNEKKVRTGDARYLDSANFLKDLPSVGRTEKAKIFQDLTSRSEGIVWNGLHFFLLFAPTEQLSDSKMTDIAMRYMEGIGFGRQPYVVYRHLDTVFPHMHVVTTNIRWDGSQVDSFRLKWRRSDLIQESIEQQFGLLSGQSAELAVPGYDPKAKIQYGKMPTTRSLGDSLHFILHTFKYRSLSALNAILGLYNIRAIGGRPGSRLHRYGGLLYQVIDDDGKGRGRPVKASEFYFKPVLVWLEKRFEANRVVDAAALGNIRFVLDRIFHDGPASGQEFLDALRRRQLAVSPVFDAKGEVGGLYFVDLDSKTVYAGSEIGKGYDAAAISSRLGFDAFPAPAKRKGLHRSVEVPEAEKFVAVQQVQKKGRSLHL